MARPAWTLNAWHRPAIVIASLATLVLVLAAVYSFLIAGGNSAEARLLSGAVASAAGVSGQGSLESGGGLRLCNTTTSRVGVAIGYMDKDGWTTEGWWNFNAGACQTLKGGPLVSRFYYVYAVDYDRGGTWGGNAAMCTRDKMFTIRGIEDCVARGYERVGFFEVDTGEQKSWTVQLTPTGQGNTG